MRYVLINRTGNTTRIVELAHDSFVVPLDDDVDPYELGTDALVNAADDPKYTVIPLIETLECEDD
jgi:hypothetical protein